MKEINDFHYLSPSGCTFWGKKRWSRKKKILWRIGSALGAPLVISLVAGIAVPVIIVGLPIYSGVKVYKRYKQANKHKRRIIVLSTVVGTSLIGPVVATLAVCVLVPVSLLTVYGVIIYSCKSDGSKQELQQQQQQQQSQQQQQNNLQNEMKSIREIITND
jgi:cytochrome bd-type quinol oxidase subunit 2